MLTKSRRQVQQLHIVPRNPHADAPNTPCGARRQRTRPRRRGGPHRTASLAGRRSAAPPQARSCPSTRGRHGGPRLAAPKPRTGRGSAWCLYTWVTQLLHTVRRQVVSGFRERRTDRVAMPLPGFWTGSNAAVIAAMAGLSQHSMHIDSICARIVLAKHPHKLRQRHGRAPDTCPEGKLVYVCLRA